MAVNDGTKARNWIDERYTQSWSNTEVVLMVTLLPTAKSFELGHVT
jgi:hypothetical protein